MNALGKFIQLEMQKRDMSQRQFAEFVGVSHVTIGKALSFQQGNSEPSLQFLIKLAKATKTDLCSLIGLIYPDEVRTDAHIWLLAERIERLPPNLREIIDNFIVGAVVNQGQQTEDS